ncbi:DHH family phosphoesterase [bacterium CPR1]|nr:DHH family phosphoesterase [bacterium CPR1]
MSPITHVLYHAHCADGFGAAFAAWSVLGEQARYLPVRHGEPPPDLPAEAHVAILDFSYARATLIELQERCQSLLVLDHHKSAQADLADLPFARFDLEKSGARLSWEYFQPLREMPELLAYVEDQDLWRFVLPESRAVSTALHGYPMDFAVWKQLSVAELVSEGRAILRYKQSLVERAASRARWTRVGGYDVPAVNSCLLQSEIGEELCQLYPEAPFAGVYYVNPKEQQAWSLRSIGEFDVSAVATLFGGGGHRNAAGFALPLDRAL